LRIDRDARPVALLARVIGRHQMLAAVLDPFDRAAESERREAYEKILGVKLAANAKSAAGAALLEHDPGSRAAENAHEAVAVAVRHLGGAVQLQDVAHRVVLRQRTARLQRYTAVPADLQ